LNVGQEPFLGREFRVVTVALGFGFYFGQYLTVAVRQQLSVDLFTSDHPGHLSIQCLQEGLQRGKDANSWQLQVDGSR